MTTDRRSFLRAFTAAGAVVGTRAAGQAAQRPAQGAYTALLTAPTLETVRWGLIGTGFRGTMHLNTLLTLPGAQITAVCDTHGPAVAKAVQLVSGKTGRAPAAFGGNGDAQAWKELLDRADVDAVLISTPWEWHTRMCVGAMLAGKHAFTEIPAALTLDDCWQLVDTCERTQKLCVMLENCTYGREELALLHMVRQGLFGELLHGEAAYIHDLREQMREVDYGTGSWRTPHYATDQGNLYPTHGLGPVAQYMDVGRGDYFAHLVSMSTPARGRQLHARANFPPDHRWNQIPEWRAGDLSSSLIKLVSGRTILVQWDETSPRPYSRHNFIQGTKGAFGGFPNRIALDRPVTDLPEGLRGKVRSRDGRLVPHQWDTDIAPWLEAYDHPLWTRVSADALRDGGHGGMDYVMLWRIQYCLQHGEPLDQTVYDAALWSAVTPLSRASVESGSAPQAFPDFTRGRWRSTPRLPIANA